jgi:type IV secretory pathway VirD2 relaxase
MVRHPGEDRFRPRPSKPRTGKAVSRRFTSQVLRAAQTGAGGNRHRIGQAGRRRFEGGRGKAAARILASRAGPRDRRVVVKVRMAVLAKAAPGSVAAHLRYIQRDGVTPDGQPGRAYGPMTDAADAGAFEERGRGDRHQFRFIVSAEDAGEIGDLAGFTRDLMSRMEADLGTRLDWIAVDHFNTDNPHSHVVLRGVDDQGGDLLIARDYLTHGLRARASELATEMLGPQTERELRERMDREVMAERWTGLDRKLVDRAQDGLFNVAAGEERLLAGRLQTLERLGLAEQTGSALWRLRADLEPALKAMGERGDIIRTMQRAFSGDGRELEILHGGGPKTTIGRVVAKGLADELGDRGYLVLDGLDGKGRYVALPPGADLGSFPNGAVVQVRTAPAGPRPSDRTIAELAQGGLYDPGRHLTIANVDARSGQDPEAFVGAHVRRLEMLRRAGIVERLGDGRWRLPEDYLARAADHEAGRFGTVQVEVIGEGPLARQTRLLGTTWLDRALIDDVRPAPTGFGAEVRQALDQRGSFLAGEGLAERHGEGWRPVPNLLARLCEREVEAVGAKLTAQTGLEHRLVENGDKVRGTYRQSVNLVSGRFAMIEDGMGFSLVPWRPVLEHRIGQAVGGIVRAGGVDWSFGRSVGL